MKFQRSCIVFFYKFLICHIFTFFAFLNQLESDILIVIWVISALFPFLIDVLSKSLESLEIDGNLIKLSLVYNLSTKFIILEPSDIAFSYKYEKGSSGMTSMEFRIYFLSRHEKIIGLGRGFDGWSKDIIFEIIEGFKKLEIKEIE